MNFKLFFEAHQSFIEKIQDAIDKVSERPFKELFKGADERFLVRVYSPSFIHATNDLKELGLDVNKFNFSKRTYDGVNYNTFLKRLANHEKDNIRKANVDGKIIEFADEVKKLNQGKIDFAIDEMRRDGAMLVEEPDPLKKGENKYGLYSFKKSLICSFKDSKFFRQFQFDKPLTDSELRRLVDALFHLEIDFDIGGGYLEAFGNVIRTVKLIQKTYFDRKNHVYKIYRSISRLKQNLDQNTIFYYLLFSRHPIDVLRMSDHRGISSCHRLDGGEHGKYSTEPGDYQHCALADAKNDGGIVYLVRGSDADKIKKQLNDKEVFEDRDRDTGLIRPLGRIRLRRFIDILTGKDFAVPSMLTGGQKYGLFTQEIYDEMMKYVREHQSIYKKPPDKKYASDNIVMVGGNYDDSYLSSLLNNFFNGSERSEDSSDLTVRKTTYGNIKHITGSVHGWATEMQNLVAQYGQDIKPFYFNYEIQQENQTIKMDFGITLTFDATNIKEMTKERLANEMKMILWNSGVNVHHSHSITNNEYRNVMKEGNNFVFTMGNILLVDDPEECKEILDDLYKNKLVLMKHKEEVKKDMSRMLTEYR